MHLDEERLQRLLHGELEPASEASARRHLAECAECRDRRAEAAREESAVFESLRALDHAPPDVDAAAIAARARGHRSGRIRRAAAILLAIGAAGAAYSAPGSPLPAWLQTVMSRVGLDREPPGSVQTPPGQVDAPGAGVAVDPGDSLLIVFRSSATAAEASVSLTEGGEAVIRTLEGAATFTSDPNRVVIDVQNGTARFEIAIPRDAPRVEIRVGGTRLFLKEGTRIVTETPGDTTGPFHLPLRPGRPGS